MDIIITARLLRNQKTANTFIGYTITCNGVTRGARFRRGTIPEIFANDATGVHAFICDIGALSIGKRNGFDIVYIDGTKLVRGDDTIIEKMREKRVRDAFGIADDIKNENGEN